MNQTEILNTLKSLANSQGFYSRLYQSLSDGSAASNEFLALLEKKHFKDTLDLILYFEG